MAAAGFRTRKIKSEQSIGDRLKRARIRRKISVAEVEEATRIRAKFILALEGDSWDQIPSEVYGRGYLETYLDFLRLPTEQIMKEYDRSRMMYARSCKDSRPELVVKSSVRIPRFLLTPRFVMVAIAALGILGFTGAIGSQLTRLNSAPFLQVETAQAASSEGTDLVVATDTVNVTGRTAPDAAVTVNGEPVVVQEDGTFSQIVAVQKGVNAVTIEATTGNGKMTKEIRTIIVK